MEDNERNYVVNVFGEYITGDNNLTRNINEANRYTKTDAEEKASAVRGRRVRLEETQMKEPPEVLKHQEGWFDANQNFTHSSGQRVAFERAKTIILGEACRLFETGKDQEALMIRRLADRFTPLIEQSQKDCTQFAKEIEELE